MPQSKNIFVATKEFALALIRMLVSLMGAESVRKLLAAHFPPAVAGITDAGEIMLRSENLSPHIQKLISLLVAALTNSFGVEFTNNALQRLFSDFQVRYQNDLRLVEILDYTPIGFLEEQRVRLLSRKELEERVLERTRELQELNTQLETRILERTKELVSANAELEKVSRAKSEFVSLVAHQMLAPLTAIRWMLVEFQENFDKAIGEEGRHAIVSTVEIVAKMASLIENLLNLTRIEQGRFEYVFEKMDANTIARDAVSMFAPLARNKSVELAFTPSEDACLVMADKDKLFLAFENVLDNALKYTPAGKPVTLSVSPQRDRVIIAVKDEGVGIPKKDQSRIFEKFFRATNVAQGGSDGTGLGLFLVKAIVENHGGAVSFESKGEGGTTFFIDLPRATETEEPSRTP